MHYSNDLSCKPFQLGQFRFAECTILFANDLSNQDMPLDSVRLAVYLQLSHHLPTLTSSRASYLPGAFQNLKAWILPAESVVIS